MVDPVRTLIGALERELAAVPGATLFPGAGADAASRFRAVFGSEPPPGMAAFLTAHDGGRLAPGSDLLTLSDAATRFQSMAASGQRGLWPFLEHRGRLFALDAEGTSTDGEWPVVEVTDRGVDRDCVPAQRLLDQVADSLEPATHVGEPEDKN